MGRFDRLPGIDDTNTRRRNVLVGLVYAVAGFAAIGALGSDGEEPGDDGGTEPDGGKTTTETDAVDTTPQDQGTTTETETEEGPPQAGELSPVSENTGWLLDRASFSGSGQVVTDTFPASFFTTFVYEHDGSSNFIVELINDDTGDREAILVNKIGQTAGAVGTGPPDANYLLEVNADGNWSIELGEPYAPEDEWGVPPATISGDANGVFGEVEIDGRVTVSGQHEGDENFMVMMWDEANTGPFADELAVNDIGQFEGETSVQLKGLFYVTVKANGPYRIEIE